MRIEDLEALMALGSEVTTLGERAVRAKHVVADAAGAPTAFGAYPAGVAFGAHHDAVAEVLAAMLDAMARDVQVFGENITASAKAYRDADDTIQAGLVSIANLAPAPGSTEADRAFEQSRQQHAAELTDVTVTSEDAQEAGASPEAVELLGGKGAGSAGEPVEETAPAGAGGFDE